MEVGKSSLLERPWYFKNKTKHQQQQLESGQAPKESQNTWLSSARAAAEVRGQENTVRKLQVSAEMTQLHLEESSEKVNNGGIEEPQEYVRAAVEETQDEPRSPCSLGRA